MKITAMHWLAFTFFYFCGLVDVANAQRGRGVSDDTSIGGAPRPGDREGNTLVFSIRIPSHVYAERLKSNNISVKIFEKGELEVSTSSVVYEDGNFGNRRDHIRCSNDMLFFHEDKNCSAPPFLKVKGFNSICLKPGAPARPFGYTTGLENHGNVIQKAKCLSFERTWSLPRSQ